MEANASAGEGDDEEDQSQAVFSYASLLPSLRLPVALFPSDLWRGHLLTDAFISFGKSSP